MKNLQQLMLDHSPNMMLLVQPTDLRIVLVNQAAVQVLGYSEEQLLGMLITDIESSLQDVFYWEDVRSGQYLAIEDQRGEYQRADASLLTVTKSVCVIHDQAAPLLLVQARDVQREQQFEEQLERTLSQLQATLESTGNGILVLDWHGKITSMNRLCSTMWEIPEALLLAESLDGLDRVKRIVKDMKEFSHVDSGGRQHANLETGLDSTLNVVWNEVKYKAEVSKEYGKIPEIECFPSQLNQVFMNLLVNAAHAIAERGVITIRTGQAGEWVWIQIEDTGSGMSADTMQRIFEPFFTTKPIGKGTGLGLSVSYGIVNRHGGRIEVHSELGKGTRFTVHLPIQQEDTV